MASSSAGATGGSDPDGDADADTGSSSLLRRDLAVIAIVALLGSSVFVESPAVVDAAAVRWTGVLAGIGLALAFLWHRLASRSEEPNRSGDASNAVESDAGDAAETDAGGDGNVWNAIPPWQYDGRHVESGGLARGEQEQALRSIQKQAEELAESEDLNATPDSRRADGDTPGRDED